MTYREKHEALHDEIIERLLNHKEKIVIIIEGTEARMIKTYENGIITIGTKIKGEEKYTEYSMKANEPSMESLLEFVDKIEY